MPFVNIGPSAHWQIGLPHVDHQFYLVGAVYHNHSKPKEDSYKMNMVDLVLGSESR